MPRILLVRHADAAGNDDEDPGLSALGQHQAHQLADALDGLDVRAVWHGPKRRAEQTARVIEATIGCERVPMEGLDDRTPFPVDDRWDEYPRASWAWFEQVPTAERDPGGVDLSASWTHICSRLDESGTIVAVTHSFVIGWFVSLAMKGTPPTWTHLDVSNAAITELELRSDGQFLVHRFNDTSHLHP